MPTLSPRRLRRMFNTRAERFRRMFNTRAERFRRWLKLYLASPDVQSAGWANPTPDGHFPELGRDTLNRLFWIWARKHDPDALEDDDRAPKMMMR